LFNLLFKIHCISYLSWKICGRILIVELMCQEANNFSRSG
jgi:hypothetical protein